MRKIPATFRLSKQAHLKLKELCDEIKKNNVIQLSKTDIIEVLLKRADSKELISKINEI